MYWSFDSRSELYIILYYPFLYFSNDLNETFSDVPDAQHPCYELNMNGYVSEVTWIIYNYVLHKWKKYWSVVTLLHFSINDYPMEYKFNNCNCQKKYYWCLNQKHFLLSDWILNLKLTNIIHYNIVYMTQEDDLVICNEIMTVKLSNVTNYIITAFSHFQHSFISKRCRICISILPQCHRPKQLHQFDSVWHVQVCEFRWECQHMHGTSLGGSAAICSRMCPQRHYYGLEKSNIWL